MQHKFYSFETNSRLIKESLRNYLHFANIYYELSGCFDGWHFEVKCNQLEVDKINRYLDICYGLESCIE